MKKDYGITLIALVITIIVLLIVAGVSIATLTGDKGIIQKVIEAADKHKTGEEKEKIKLAVTEANMDEDKSYFFEKVINILSKEVKIETEIDKITNILKIIFKDTGNSYKIDNKGNFIEIGQNRKIELIEIKGTSGNVPGYDYYKSDSLVTGRGIKALKEYDGKIYLGLGDYNKNTGPTPILYYDPVNDTIIKENIIDNTGVEITKIKDEAIESYSSIDGILYTTGCDPTISWGYGSFYRYNKETSLWEQHLFHNGWIHALGIEKFKDKIFMSGEVWKNTNTNTQYSPIQYSTDNGETFQNVHIIYKGNEVSYNSDFRCRRLYQFKGKLYAYFKDSNTGENNEYIGFYLYDEANNQFNYISEFPEYKYDYSTPFYLSWYTYSSANYDVYEDNFLLTLGNGMFKSIDMTNFTLVTTGNDDIIQRTVVKDGKLYTLAYKYNSTDGTFVTRIYCTTDLENFEKIYEFDTDTPPFSIEYYDNSFYVGTSYSCYYSGDSWKNECVNLDKNGTFYRIKISYE